MKMRRCGQCEPGDVFVEGQGGGTAWLITKNLDQTTECCTDGENLSEKKRREERVTETHLHAQNRFCLGLKVFTKRGEFIQRVRLNLLTLQFQLGQN